MKEAVTIRDIAREAGVSIATVSRVLNGDPRVNMEMVERVQAAAKALRYRPNAVARSLKNKSTALIAFLVSNIADPFFTQISKGAEDVFFRQGYNLLIGSTNFSVEKERSLLHAMQERRVEGIILNTCGENEEMIARLSHSVPVILCNRSISQKSYTGDFVDFDNIGGICDLTRQLLEKGHRNIGILNGPFHLSTARERFQGFCYAMAEVGLKVDEKYPYLSCGADYSEAQGYVAAAKLMEKEIQPTAIIATNSEYAVGALKYFKQRQISIPEDISFVYFGNISHHELLSFDVTHSKMDLNAMGARIAYLMLERIGSEDSTCGNREIRLSTQVEVGNSIRVI